VRATAPVSVERPRLRELITCDVVGWETSALVFVALTQTTTSAPNPRSHGALVLAVHRGLLLWRIQRPARRQLRGKTRKQFRILEENQANVLEEEGHLGPYAEGAKRCRPDLVPARSSCRVGEAMEECEMLGPACTGITRVSPHSPYIKKSGEIPGEWTVRSRNYVTMYHM
jgi:hypothetical protein